MELPEWLSLEAWDGYVEMRQKIRKPMTERAKKMAIKILDKLRKQGHDPSMVLDQSTFMDWQGLYPPKEPQDGERADRKTFDAIRREASAAAIKRTVGAYQQMARPLFGNAPPRTKPGGDGGVH